MVQYGRTDVFARIGTDRCGLLVFAENGPKAPTGPNHDIQYPTQQEHRRLQG